MLVCPVRRIVGAAALLLVGALFAPLQSDEPVSSSVTFSREVIRIFEGKCLPCHAPGAIAMSLATYRDVRPWARAVREELVEKRMPPWVAAPGYGRFANDMGLNIRELATILTWTDGGVPQGDDRDLPLRDATHRHDVPVRYDQQVALPVQRVPAGEEHVIRRVTIDAGATAPRWLRHIDIVPGNTRIMRAAFVSLVAADGHSPGQWIGAWTPWLRSIAAPEGAALLLPAGARFLVELHYRGRDTDLEDRSSLALSFASQPRIVTDQLVVHTAPASELDGRRRAQGTARLRQEARLWAILPQVSASGPPPGDAYADPAGAPSLEVTARKPDGSVEVLLWIPRQRFDWPTPYVLRTPVLLPAGTTVAVTATAPFGTGSGEMPPPNAVTLSTYRSLAATGQQARRTRPPR